MTWLKQELDLSLSASSRLHMKQALCVSTYLSNVKPYTSVPVPAICLLILTQLAIQIESGFEFCHQTPHVFCCPARYVSRALQSGSHTYSVFCYSNCTTLLFRRPYTRQQAQALTIAHATEVHARASSVADILLALLRIVSPRHRAGNRSNPRNVFYVHKPTIRSQGTGLTGSQQQEVVM